MKNVVPADAWHQVPKTDPKKIALFALGYVSAACILFWYLRQIYINWY